MSNVIKSFRVVEKELVEEIVQESKDNSMDNNIIKEFLINEAKSKSDMIIKIAEERAKSILEEVEKQKQGILGSAYIESEKILEIAKEKGYKDGLEQGYEEGFKQGYEEGKVVSDKLIEESLEIKNEYISSKENLLEELEQDIIQLVIDIYEKILGNQLEEDQDAIISLVLNGIKNLDSTDQLTIIVSKEDYNILEDARDEILARASLISELNIKYDIDMSKGDCILETLKGSVDISLKDQLDEVKELLTTILNNE